MQKALYAGSFDPVTLGHLDIIERAAKITDQLVVAILENPNKTYLFTAEERKEHLQMVTKHLPNVEVMFFEGLCVDFAKKIGATVAIRGLRNSVDFANEFQMHLINGQLNNGLETIFLAADKEHLALSSTNVKEVATFGGNIDNMVPAEIRDLIHQKYKKRGE